MYHFKNYLKKLFISYCILIVKILIFQPFKDLCLIKFFANLHYKCIYAFQTYITINFLIVMYYSRCTIKF
ncbi:hypothetical protein C2G38_2093235 [Gigaspora rosea]|uniref:Uncharacterized protein n=1 Tax=Gigaspora rosea TaxID=44941 RepID=A0A397V670_9GLOM|nr:hypothetical protein C2G38_2093235 [Gigaspora rosea]